MTAFNESTVEQAALDWLSALGWQVLHGPDIAPGASGGERDDYRRVVERRRQVMNRPIPIKIICPTSIVVRSEQVR